MAYRRRHCKNQMSISKALVIPENKPDIERVIRITSTPEIRKTTIIKGKVVLTGDVIVFVEYVALSRCNTQPLHFAEFKIPIAHFVDHRCAQPWQDARISAAVEFQEIQVINRRTLNIFLILEAVVLQLDGSRILIKSQTCSSTDVTTQDSGCLIPWSFHDQIEDCSAGQSCSCASCTIES